MMPSLPSDISVGRYRGAFCDAYGTGPFLAQLERLDELVAAGGPQPRVGRSRVVRAVLTRDGVSLPVAVKAFGAQSAFKDRLDRTHGSRARRSWSVACALAERGVGTPAPIGFLERWDGAGLAESYYLSVYEDAAVPFRDELARLYREDPEVGRILRLVERVVAGVRAMHDAGVVHGDMGNQNILLEPGGRGDWGEAMFVDLNRARVKTVVSARERAFDVSRIALPSDLLRIFIEMYFQPARPPASFMRWQRLYRRRFALHTWSRGFRHPLRTRRRRKAGAGAPCYPAPRDLWVWDERSCQAIGVMGRAERKRHYSTANALRIAAGAAAAASGIWCEYRRLRQACFAEPVALPRRIGVAVHPTPATAERELDALARLGAIPTLVRFYHHRSKDERALAGRLVHDLAQRGHPVSAALVQDRRAVLEPASWAAFVEETLDRVGGVVEWVELGHAVNRVKWGVWELGEYRRMLEAAAALRTRYPSIRFMGPAVIDFEYPFAIAALRNMPDGMRFDALSLHLYVDRRGAPENRQGRFDALSKFALARALARRAGQCADRVIVSEVNWPLKGTGVFSPVGSPYESPGPRTNDPSVSEQDYANYMIRYLVPALCSGMIERVYWWRLVARGFGLIDDTDPARWRERPAYAMLKHFLALLGASTFERRLDTPPGVHAYVFRLADGAKAALAYASGGESAFEPPFAYDGVLDHLGRELPRRAGPVRLGGAPVYFLGVRS